MKNKTYVVKSYMVCNNAHAIVNPRSHNPCSCKCVQGNNTLTPGVSPLSQAALQLCVYIMFVVIK